jgi:hypothetical protein
MCELDDAAGQPTDRRPHRGVVIVVALVVSITAGCAGGSLQADRGLASRAGVEPSAGFSAADDARAATPEDLAGVVVGEVSEVRPTDLVEGALDRGVAPPPPGPDDFVTPSGNILCAYAGGQLDCHVGSGLTPTPSRPCPPGTGDWSGIRLGRTGPSVPWCTDVRLGDRPPPMELAYGRDWARDGIECVSQRSGLRCHNDDGEFLLSRAATRHGRRPTGS